MVCIPSYSTGIYELTVIKSISFELSYAKVNSQYYLDLEGHSVLELAVFTKRKGLSIA